MSALSKAKVQYPAIFFLSTLQSLVSTGLFFIEGEGRREGRVEGGWEGAWGFVIGLCEPSWEGLIFANMAHVRHRDLVQQKRALRLKK